MEIIMDNITTILTWLATVVPLVIALISFVQKAVKEKNWSQLVKLVSDLMVEAEKLFDNGADRKQYVLMAIESSADTINYPVNMAEVSKLIDDLCDMSKGVNVKIEAPKPKTKAKAKTETK